MNQTPEQTRSVSARTSSLWAAIGALGVVVIALGSALYFVQTRRVEPRAIIALDLATPAAEVAVAPAAPASAVSNSQSSKEKKAAPKEKQATAATKSVATSATPPVPVAAAPAAASPSEVAPAAGGPAVSQTRVCANCGTVTAVTPVEREGTPSGAGVVAGGVLGALVGNQFGGGDGKTVATILGAIGGGMAGNTVEKKMKKETVYQVQLRMEDGSTRTVEQTTPATVGAKVTVEGGALRSADGSLSTPVPSAPAARSGGG